MLASLWNQGEAQTSITRMTRLARSITSHCAGVPTGVQELGMLGNRDSPGTGVFGFEADSVLWRLANV